MFEIWKLLLNYPKYFFKHRQHLPFLSDEKASCKQIIDKGLIKEVRCEEEAYFKPLSDYGYVVKAIGRSFLKKLPVLPITSTGGAPACKPLLFFLIFMQ